jgi:DNA-binding NtrC family response regulator
MTHSKSVLVVEDRDDLRLMVADILADAGNDVLAAANFQEAVELWRRSGKTVPVALIDLSLGGSQNGEQLAIRLKTESPEVQLIITSGGVPSFSEESRWLKDVPFLQKPYSPKQLANLVSLAQEQVDSAA